VIFRSSDPQITIPTVSLPELILSRAEQFGEKKALTNGLTGQTYTFSEFAECVRQAAGGLSAAGFKKGDVIALLAPNSPEFGVVFLAAALVGGVNTTLNPVSTRQEVEAQMRDSGARFLFTVPELLDRTPTDTIPDEHTIVLGDVPGTIGFQKLLESRIEAPTTQIDPETDIVVLPYSSGTTGFSKGVQLTHRNLVANLRQISSGIFTGNDVIVGIPPYFHIYGLTVVLLLGLYLGTRNVTLPRFEMNSFLDAIEKYGVTHANLVPPLILMLANHPTLDPARLKSLRTVQSGAAPLPAQTATTFSERFDCRVTQGYGLSEASPVTHLAPRDSKDIPIESIGPPVPGTECKILDTETGVEMDRGHQGELYVRGPQVMQGYLNDPEKTAAMLDSEGWLRTGDIASTDEQGNFYIVDRAKELIKYKGYAIAPAELEALLLTHPEVEDAAVIPSLDVSAGEVPKAYVVCKRALPEGELLSWVAERVSPHKKIRSVEFVEEIPKSASGKILRRVLIDLDRRS
jgi:acyl-CoA synthetase (AMP-forming)/AMP-acid ligase II